MSTHAGSSFTRKIDIVGQKGRRLRSDRRSLWDSEIDEENGEKTIVANGATQGPSTVQDNEGLSKGGAGATNGAREDPANPAVEVHAAIRGRSQRPATMGVKVIL